MTQVMRNESRIKKKMRNDTLIRSLSTFTHVRFRNSVQRGAMAKPEMAPWFNGMKSKAIALGCVRSPNTYAGRGVGEESAMGEVLEGFMGANARIYFNAHMKKKKKKQRVTPR